MKKSALITVLNLFLFSICYAQWNGNNPLTTSSKVGIGINTPMGNLEIASPTGGLLSLSSAGMAGSKSEPISPSIEFIGYNSWKKARISAKEMSRETSGSAFSIWVNDAGGADHLVERFTISANGNIGIGTENPLSNLEIASPTGGLLSLSSAGMAGSKSEPISPSIEFIGYNNWKKARISTKEMSRETTGSAFSIWVNDEGGSDLLVERFTISANGYIGVGTTNPQYKLDVCGTIRAQEIKVDLQGGCDFVFDKDYPLMDLKTLEAFVKTNQHLPEIAPEKQMVEEGLNMKEFQLKLLQKLEELTLYVIDQNKQMEALKQTVQIQDEKINQLENKNK